MQHVKTLRDSNIFSNKSMYTFFFVFAFSISSFSQSNIFDICRKGSLEDITKLYNNDNTIVNAKNEHGYSALTLACYSGNFEVVKFMVDKVETVNGKSKFGSPLMAATVKGEKEIVKLLLDHKAEVNITDAQGITALHYATMFNKEAIVKLLFDAGADAKLKDTNGKSALDHAETMKNEKIIKILKNS